MKLSLDLKTTLSQTLTPQQIQYLKLLQLPVMQLEQQVRQEIEQNPMLEEVSDDDDLQIEILDSRNEDLAQYSGDEKPEPDERDQIPDDSDPFEFHKMLWQDDSSYSPKIAASDYEDDENDGFQIKSSASFTDDLISQFRLIPLTKEELYLGEQIIGNIDDDGYLRRNLEEIVEETNISIAELNYRIAKEQEEAEREYGDFENPARKYALSEESTGLLNRLREVIPEISDHTLKDIKKEEQDRKEENGKIYYDEVTVDQAEKLLGHIRHLEPPGIGSRTIQECLVAQLEVKRKPNAAEKLAYEVLTQTYDEFTKKHYQAITKKLEVSEDYLREAIDAITRLNPKPGGGDYQSEMNTVIPDFTIEIDEEKNDLIINLNDSRLPSIKLNKAYEKLKKETQYKLSNKETKEWIRNKYEDAKFLIQAIRQRKNTMLKVMTAIAHLQRDFFFEGENGLKPLIYKNVAEKTGLDISTVCRIVNGKYVQTPYGTYELKYFFSESLPTDEGEEVSTRIIKQKLKEIIDGESKKKPMSDEKLSKELKKEGFNVARRTVAKYREQLKIPVARLRKTF